MKNKFKLLIALLSVLFVASAFMACTPLDQVSVPDSEKISVQFVDHDGTVISSELYLDETFIVVPADPTREDSEGYTYTFAGWDKEINPLAEENVVYTATYEKTPILYTVTFKADGAQVGEVFEYTVENKEIAFPNVPAKEHYTAQWEINELTYGNVVINAVYTPVEYVINFMDGETLVEAVSFNVENYGEKTAPAAPTKAEHTSAWGAYDFAILANQTVQVVYTSIYYTVTFKADGVIVSEQEYTAANKDIVEPAVPNKDHYTGKWEAYTLTTGDLVVNAVYTPVEYTINFKDGETLVEAVKFNVENYGEKVAPAVPAKTGYTSVWGAYDFNKLENQTVQANHTIIVYTVTFKADGVQVGEVLEYTVENASVVAPAVPEKAGYTGEWEAYTLTTGNVVVNAIYELNGFVINFKDGETLVAAVKFNVENYSEKVAPAVPEKAGYTGVWGAYDFTKLEDQTVQAVYTAIVYTVTFKADGEKVGEATYTVENANVTAPAVPEKAHYTGAWEAYTLTLGNKEVNAIYTPVNYVINFKNGETLVEAVSFNIENASEKAAPIVPTKEHYTSVWGAYDFAKLENQTVQVIYTPVTYTVTFMADGAKVGEATYTVENTSVTAPSVPAKAGYTGKWEAYEVTTGNLTVNAVYTVINYTITFKNGNEVVEAVSFNVENGSEKVAPSVPTKVGYSSAWGEYSFTNLVDQTVQVVYTANLYEIKLNANGGSVESTTVKVAYDSEWSLDPATPAKMYQEFLGWFDSEGNKVTGGVWKSTTGLSLTAKYSENLSFETYSSIPSFMATCDTAGTAVITEALSTDGSKALQIPVTGSAPGLRATIEFVASFFADSNVEAIAFDARTDNTRNNNFRRVTQNGSNFSAKTYEADNAYNGIANWWKTFYFTRADYNAWISNNATFEKFITSGGFSAGENIYVDNMRPVTSAQISANTYGFENAGLRLDGKNILVYTSPVDYSGTWNFGFLNNVAPTDYRLVEGHATQGSRALQVTRPAGTSTIRFNNNTVKMYKDMISTGYYAFDIWVPEGSDAKIEVYNAKDNGTSREIIKPKKGAWNTIYIGGYALLTTQTNPSPVTITDTTGGTYAVDNFRCVTQEEYNAYIYGFENFDGALRTDKVPLSGTESVAYFYGATDHQNNTFSFAVSGSSSVQISAAWYETSIVHSGNYSLAFTKANGYISLSMNTNSEAYKLLKNGFTFWIYADTVNALNGQTATNFIDGCNNKFNGGEGLIVYKQTWTQITVPASSINGSGRFLIIQGSTGGTIYIDDIQPL